MGNVSSRLLESDLKGMGFQKISFFVLLTLFVDTKVVVDQTEYEGQAAPESSMES